MANTYADSANTKAISPGRALGGATLTLTTGAGVNFGAPTPSAPMRVGVYRNGSIVPLTVLKCTGRTGDVLTISGTMDGYADAAVLAGDVIDHGVFAGDMDDLQAAISTISLTPGPPGSVWREGSGAPASSLGIDGDYYLDGATGDVYLRTSGAYAVVCNIKGATGATGSPGADGATGPAGVGSFGISVPSALLSVTGSPLTSSGVIDMALVSQAANVVFAGPASGAGGLPSYRLLAVADVPDIPESKVTNLVADLAAKAADSSVVHNTGNETIAGTKTFSSPIAGSITGNAATATTAAGLSASIAESQVTNLVSDLAAKANDSAVVHLAGSETITGAKTLTTPIAKGASTTDVLRLQDASAASVGGFDKDGYGFVEKATFLLGVGQDLATGTNLTTVGAIASANGKLVKCKVKAAVNGAGGGFTFDLKKNGTSVLSAPIAVAASITTVSGSTSFTSTAVSEGDVFTVDVTAVGSGVQYVNITLYYLVRNV